MSAARYTGVTYTNHTAICWHKDCTHIGTVWAHFQWWCAAHAPASTPDPNCTHSLRNTHFGVEVCSWCCGHLADPDPYEPLCIDRFEGEKN